MRALRLRSARRQGGDVTRTVDYVTVALSDMRRESENTLATERTCRKSEYSLLWKDLAILDGDVLSCKSDIQH